MARPPFSRLGHRLAAAATVILPLLGTIALVTSLVAGMSTPAHAQARAGVDMFYDSLSPYGEWVEHPRYGYIWYPTSVDDDWRPYTRGHWVNTEEYGWMWVDNAAWGWAPFHYGRWAFDDDYGWFWVPGSEWGPAWVAWRGGGDHIGWAPLPPEVRWSDGRFDYAGIDFEGPRYRSYWVFVPERHFVSTSLFSYCVPPARNVTIIRNTTNVTNYTTVNNVIINKSINVNRIQTVINRPVPVVRVQQAASFQQHTVGKASSFGGAGPRTVSVFRPTVAIDRSMKPAALGRFTPGSPSPRTAPPATTTPGTNGAAAGAGTGPRHIEIIGKGAAQAPNAVAGSGAKPGVNAGAANPASPAAPGGTAPAAAPATTPANRVAVGARPPADPRLRQLEAAQNNERRRLDREHIRERVFAAPAQKPVISQSQVQENAELKRIQEQRRAVVTNRAAVAPQPPPARAQPASAPANRAPAPPQNARPPQQAAKPPQQQPAQKKPPQDQQGPGGAPPPR